MDNSIVAHEHVTRHLLIPSDVTTDTLSKLKLFVKWLKAQGYNWSSPNLAQYRDYLLQDYANHKSYEAHANKPLSPASVNVHLATIRGRYRDLLKSNDIRDLLFEQTPQNAPASDKRAYVQEILTRLKNDIEPSNAPVKVVTKQDVSDSEHHRLTGSQIIALVNSPGTDTLLGLRDTAIMALMVATGIREQELVNLDVSDLRDSFGGELSLIVREGKGCKQRLIPYGDMSFVLEFVEKWLEQAGIQDGAVFRGFYKGAQSVRATRIHKRAINQILDKYRVVIDGEPVAIKPHDLRRTYARRCYDMNMDILRIQQNLGHNSHLTTLKYIGEYDASERRPPALFELDMTALDYWNNTRPA